MRRISNYCYQLVNARVMWASSVVFVLFLVFVLPNMAGTLPVSPDSSFIYSASDIYDMAESYGPEGRAYYIRTRYTFDVVWPIVYLAFLAAGLSALFRSSGSLVNLLPFGAVALDFLENIAASVVMHRFPDPAPIAAHVAPVFTFFKWILVALSFAALFVGIVLAAKARILDGSDS